MSKCTIIRNGISQRNFPVLLLILLGIFPLFVFVNASTGALLQSLCPLLIFGILGIGLHVVTGCVGALHLGVAGFMAIGAYSFAISSSKVYPFQLPWILALSLSVVLGALFGLLLAVPVIRLRGDYFAIVSLGFGEIVQDSLRNLEPITKGTIGINPVPAPLFLSGSNDPLFVGVGWYYLLYVMLLFVLLLVIIVERSVVGRGWMAIRDDELAARCLGIRVNRAKVFAIMFGSALCAMAGGLWVSYLGATGEPGNYDLQISVVILCGLILGGLGNIWGSIIGVFFMVGFNSLVLTRITDLLTQSGMVASGNVIALPLNWKYFVFGMALILLMRFRPQGLFPAAIR